MPFPNISYILSCRLAKEAERYCLLVSKLDSLPFPLISCVASGRKQRKRGLGCYMMVFELVYSNPNCSPSLSWYMRKSRETVDFTPFVLWDGEREMRREWACGVVKICFSPPLFDPLTEEKRSGKKVKKTGGYVSAWGVLKSLHLTFHFSVLPPHHSPLPSFPIFNPLTSFLRASGV